MLQLRRTGWRSSTYRVSEEGRPVATLAAGRGAGKMRIDGTVYSFGGPADEGGRDVVLSGEGTPLARARWSHGPRPAVEVRTDGGTMWIRPTGCLDRRGLVSDHRGSPVGLIHREGALSRTIEADLPGALPLSVRLFLVAMMMGIWRRLDEEAALLTVTLGGC